MSELIAMYGDLIDFANALAGRPICAVRCEHDGQCTRDTGHAGEHESRGSDGETIYCTWSEWDE